MEINEGGFPQTPRQAFDFVGMSRFRMERQPLRKAP
jgi:hypothetical protein